MSPKLKFHRIIKDFYLNASIYTHIKKFLTHANKHIGIQTQRYFKYFDVKYLRNRDNKKG